MPILVILYPGDFIWNGQPHLLAEWDILVAAFEAARYKVKDCTKEPFVGINVTSDTQGNYYLDQKDKIEGLVKAARVTGVKVQKLPCPLDGPYLSDPTSYLKKSRTSQKPFEILVYTILNSMIPLLYTSCSRLERKK